MRKNLTALLAMAMFAEGMSNPHPTKTRTSIKREKKKIIPKGCKQYHFRESGNFDLDGEQYNDIKYIFTCVAMNDKSAVRKFNKRKR